LNPTPKDWSKELVSPSFPLCRSRFASDCDHGAKKQIKTVTLCPYWLGGIPTCSMAYQEAPNGRGTISCTMVARFSNPRLHLCPAAHQTNQRKSGGNSGQRGTTEAAAEAQEAEGATGRAATAILGSQTPKRMLQLALKINLESAMQSLITDILSYFKVVFGEGIRLVFTLFDVVGVIFFFFPAVGESIGLNVSEARSIGGGIFLASFIIANFLVYQTLLHKTAKKPGTLDLRKKSALWRNSGSRDGIPVNPLECRIHFKMSNLGDEPVDLREFSVSSITTTPSYFASQPSSVKWNLESDAPNLQNRQVNFPYRVQQQTLRVTLICSIEINFIGNDGIAFVKQLKELSDYAVKFKYAYETMDDKIYERYIDVQGSFDEYRKKTLKDWVREKKYQLLFEAINVDDVIDKL
jgi:hypothetical protein